MSEVESQAVGGRLKATVGDVIGCAWSGVSCLVMAWLFWTAWWHPLELDNGRWVKLGVGIMLLEFILVHSGGIMHHMMRKRTEPGSWKTVTMLMVVYTIFAVGFAVGFKSWWLFGSYVMVMSGRLWALTSGKWSDMDKAISQRRMVASVLLYLGLIFATTFLPVPRGGITRRLVDKAWEGMDSSGVWMDHPEKALAMGMVYFLILGLVEIRPPRRMSKLAA